MTDSLGLDLKTVLGSMFGARLAGVAGTPKTVEKAEAEVVAEAEAPKAEAPKAPAQESEQVFPGITNAQAESIAAQLLGDQQRRRRR